MGECVHYMWYVVASGDVRDFSDISKQHRGFTHTDRGAELGAFFVSLIDQPSERFLSMSNNGSIITKKHPSD